jgi:hypothetical protein
MALEAVVDSLESVSEALRGEYVEKEGKFYLNLNNGDALPFVAGLKSAVASERGTRAALEKKIKGWESIGKSPEEISELVSKATKDAEELARKAGDFDGIRKQLEDKFTAEKTTIAGERDTAVSAARKAIVDAGLAQSLAKAKATASGQQLLTKILGERVKTEFADGEFRFTVLAADGRTPLVGTGEGGHATFDDLVKETVKSFPELFEGSGAGGGGKSPREGTGGSGLTITQAELTAMSPKERAAAMAKPGVKLID